jgi:phosphatidylethanolamine N-methyltransferase
MEPRYHLALLDQPQKALLSEGYRIIFSAALFITGQVFVITSTWALGITGTFLGDYFGILMDHRVEGYVSSGSFFSLGKVFKSIHSSFN